MHTTTHPVYTYRTNRDGSRIAHYRYTTAKGEGWDLARCTGPTDTSRRACSGDHWHESDGERCSHCFLNQSHTLDQHRAAIAEHDRRMDRIASGLPA